MLNLLSRVSRISRSLTTHSTRNFSSFEEAYQSLGDRSITMQDSRIQLPRRIGLLGYGAVGKCFVEMLLNEYPNADLVVMDLTDLKQKESRFQYMKNRINKENYSNVFDQMGLYENDILVDLSTDIGFIDMWNQSLARKIMYVNSALEEWPEALAQDNSNHNHEDSYKISLEYLKDKVSKEKNWKKDGTTSVFEFGCNPGLISQFVKVAIEDCAKWHLQHKVSSINLEKLEKALEMNNHSKMAQALQVYTIHCCEKDNQTTFPQITDSSTKFYNTWSCRGFLTEAMVPIQVAKGSHENDDLSKFDLHTIEAGRLYMSKSPSYKYAAKSWVPNQDIEGFLIPHGESFSLRSQLEDKKTGYAPSLFFVYDVNPYTRNFMVNLPDNSSIETLQPKTQILNPHEHNLKGYDKIGGLLLMKGNRGWWTGSVMDDLDSTALFGSKFSPTIIQVAAGVYSGFLWACNNPNRGTLWPEQLDQKFILERARPYLGRLISMPVDLNKTSLKDCYKLKDFITKSPKRK